jgi:methionine-gamma-lyase
MKKLKSTKTAAQKSAKNKNDYKIRTRLIHGTSKSPKWDYSHHVVPPISSSATFRLSSTHRGAQGFFEFACDKVDTTRHIPIYIYDRLDEPTRGMLEDNLAQAEQGDVAVTFATGMAAISAAICSLTRTGEHVIAHDTLYGCTYSLLTNWMPRQGVTTSFVNMSDLKAVEKAIKKTTRVLYFESPVNPNLEMIDIGGLKAIADKVNKGRSEVEKVRLVIDNTFASPYCQRPLTLGADVVVHSLTKSIGGFGTDMGGVIIAPKSLHNTIMLYRKDFGGVLSPKAAWNVLVYGLPSLATRMVNMQRSALYVAEYLEQHPKVAKVLYPGLESFPQRELAEKQMTDYRGQFAPGSMIYFTLKSKGKDNGPAERFINHIADNAYCITLAVSLGQIKTLIENPYSMTHSAYQAATGKPGKAGSNGDCLRVVEPGGIRLSVGLEDRDDIIADLEKALAKA